MDPYYISDGAVTVVDDELVDDVQENDNDGGEQESVLSYGSGASPVSVV
jgi:hypothetical protein